MCDCNHKVENGAHKVLVEVSLRCRYLQGDEVLSKSVTLARGDMVYVNGIGISGGVSATNLPSSKDKDSDYRPHYQIPLPVYFAAFEQVY